MPGRLAGGCLGPGIQAELDRCQHRLRKLISDNAITTVERPMF
jgi:hypothetical protein